MRTGRILLPAVLAAVSVLITGCLSFRSHPAGIAPNVKPMWSADYEIIGEATGTSSSFTLFWFFEATPAANNAEAIDDAIKSKGGDNLIEAVFTTEKMYYIVGTVTNIYVKGKVIRYIRDGKKPSKNKRG